MEIVIGTTLLLVVLALFTLFSYKAPKGMKAMGALANAACAVFLVEAFQRYVGGDLIGIAFLGEVGDVAGNMGGVAATALVCLALGVSPVYALMMGASVAGFGMLPGFIAGYIIAWLVLQIEKRVPGGLDLIVTIMVATPLVRLVAQLVNPVVQGTLLKIGGALETASNGNPVMMGVLLGGIITVVATGPLSSMALTALLELQGLPMAIGALAVMGSSFMNFVLFHKMKFGNRETNISVAIEPLTQIDIISANPVPIYVTNFIGGAAAGVIVALFGLVNNASGTATPIAGLAVMYGFNPAMKVTICAMLCALAGGFSGLLGSILFKNVKIKTIAEIRGEEEIQIV